MRLPFHDAGTTTSVDAVVATVIAEMSAHLVEESRNIRQVLEREIAELGTGSQLAELLGASIEGNVDTVFHVLQHGITADHLHAPSAAMEYARRLAQNGIPVTALVRAYRLGQTTLLDRVFARIQASSIDPVVGLQVSHRILSISSVYIDWISEQVVTAYQVEHERWLANRNNVRATRIRELLSTGERSDESRLTRQIGYELAQHHCAAIVWMRELDADRDALPELERVARQMCETVEGRPNPLFVAADRLSAWVWIPLGHKPDRLAIDAVRNGLEPVDLGDVRVALGTSQYGSAGFRSSHLQAQRTLSIARLGDDARRTITYYGDPGLAMSSIVGSDIARAHEWIRATLGRLADNTEAAQRLRETLRAYFDCRSSHKATALALHLHYNTVKYRVKSAEQMLGRPISADRFDIEQALVLQSWLGDDALHSS